MTDSGKKARVVSVQEFSSDSAFQVYNIESFYFNDFAVSGGVIVHNSNKVKFE